jgi:hypothetical protein
MTARYAGSSEEMAAYSFLPVSAPQHICSGPGELSAMRPSSSLNRRLPFTRFSVSLSPMR